MRTLREEAALNYRQAAARADISDQRWRNLERGYEMRGGQRIAANPSRATVIAIAIALGDPLDKALTASGFEPPTVAELAPPPQDPLSRIEAAWPKVWAKIPQYQRDLIAEFIEALANPAMPGRRQPAAASESVGDWDVQYEGTEVLYEEEPPLPESPGDDRDGDVKRRNEGSEAPHSNGSSSSGTA